MGAATGDTDAEDQPRSGVDLVVEPPKDDVRVAALNAACQRERVGAIEPESLLAQQRRRDERAVHFVPSAVNHVDE